MERLRLMSMMQEFQIILVNDQLMKKFRVEGEAAYFSTLPIKRIVKRFGKLEFRRKFRILLGHLYVITSCTKRYCCNKGRQAF